MTYSAETGKPNGVVYKVYLGITFICFKLWLDACKKPWTVKETLPVQWIKIPCQGW